MNYDYLDGVQLDVLEGFHPAPHHRRKCFQVHSHRAVISITLKIGQFIRSGSELDCADAHLFRGCVTLSISMLHISHSNAYKVRSAKLKPINKEVTNSFVIRVLHNFNFSTKRVVHTYPHVSLWGIY